MTNFRKTYVDGPFGQIHLRIAGEMSDAPDLVCLHPAPFSGLAFERIMPHLSKGRRVIAPDFPGHGGSDPLLERPTIGHYAQSIIAVMQTISRGRSFDLFGFHTGCLVAVEAALLAMEQTCRIVLCDIPAFEPKVREELLQSNGAPFEMSADIACLTAAWERGITRRLPSQPMAEAFAMFAEQLRHGTAMNAGFYAGFSYPVEERFALLNQPVVIIATQSGLLDATRRAASLLPNATLEEHLNITRSVLDEAAERTAAAVLANL